jgi:hypothetical protein
MIIRGKQFTSSDIDLVKATIANNNSLSRRRLSILISEKLNWRQPNGRLKDRACRDVLLRLDRGGIIHLPRPNYTFTTQSVRVRQVDFVKSSKVVEGIPSEFPRPIFKLVENNHQRQLWNYLIDTYHYKGCRIAVGRHLKYLVYLDQEIIACFGFADAVLKLKSRDQWIGWDPQQRETNLHLIVNNVRFLFFPWIRIKNLASTLLSLSSRIVQSDWQRVYNYRPVLIETFVEKQRFLGTSYKAANWIYLGQTRGKGRSGMKYYDHGIIKDVYVYPLTSFSHLQKQLFNSSETTPSKNITDNMDRIVCS